MTNLTKAGLILLIANEIRGLLFVAAFLGVM